jgi:thiamine-phosphate pyrophosphorylase
MGLRSRIRGLFGASCHDEAELERAASAGCDYALISPVFSPRSKPGDRRSTLQLRGLADLASRSALPVVALGGIDSERTGPCIRAGAAAVATIGGLFPPGATPEEVEHLARDMVRAGTVARLGLS